MGIFLLLEFVTKYFQKISEKQRKHSKILCKHCSSLFCFVAMPTNDFIYNE